MRLLCYATGPSYAPFLRQVTLNQITCILDDGIIFQKQPTAVSHRTIIIIIMILFL